MTKPKKRRTHMTLDEARKIAAICETADGGCSSCVRDMACQLQEAFSEFTWTFVDRSGWPDYSPPRIDVAEARANRSKRNEQR